MTKTRTVDADFAARVSESRCEPLYCTEYEPLESLSLRHLVLAEHLLPDLLHCNNDARDDDPTKVEIMTIHRVWAN
jgi:hypothetical protein